MFDIINTIRMVRTPNIFIHGSESWGLFSQGITVVHPSFWCLIVQVSNCLVSNCPVSNCPVSNCPFTNFLGGRSPDRGNGPGGKWARGEMGQGGNARG